MNGVFKIGTEKMPSIVKDPFKKTSIVRIWVTYRVFMGDWSAHGTVEFVNGNTKGEQTFDAPDFDGVVIQVKAFLDSLD